MLMNGRAEVKGINREEEEEGEEYDGDAMLVEVNYGLDG